MKRTFLAATLVMGCAPELDDEPYLLKQDALLAVLAEPAEARPGAEVELTPVVAALGRTSRSLSFHFCRAAPPIADPRPLSEACLRDASSPLEVVDGVARGTVPSDACARFGPDPVGSDFRPRDADSTGGFYQPIVVAGLGRASVLPLRIVCPLPDVPLELSRAYRESYAPNLNPEGLRLEREVSGAWRALSSARPGEQLAVRVVWDDAARERYVWLAPDARALEPRREAFSVAWFVSAGTIGVARTGRSEDDPGNDSQTTFTAPDHSGALQFWAVVHDSRGGTAVLQQELAVHDP